MDRDALSRELILDHAGRPRNRGAMERPDAEARVSNPSCGDEITLRLRLDGDRIEEARFEGSGCSISLASASMMTARVGGMTLLEASALSRRFTDLLHGDPAAASDPTLGDLRALAGVSKFPIRVRCALLPWDALRQSIDRPPL